MQKTNSINIGIADKDREQISKGLIQFLSQTYALYFKTHNFHWNVTGHQFQTLHTLFETQYTELWTATDVIAERIRSLGVFVPQNLFDHFSNTGDEKIPSAQTMIKEVLDGHEKISKFIREILPLTESARDQSSADLLTQRLQLHEKTAWMLRSMTAEL